ncbi:MAG: pilus assembly protein PilP [Nitrospinae bacterium]|nr:pilus assembly protein PilP [Nitrospinota bacterium]
MARNVLIIVALALAGYFAYSWYGAKPEVPATQGVSDSFSAFTQAVQQGNQSAAANAVAATFSDEKLSRQDFLKVLAVPRKMYKTTIRGINIEGDAALIDYTRLEQRGEGEAEPFTVQVKRERWVRDPATTDQWKLAKLADDDTWMRTTDIPAATAVAVPEGEKESVLADVQKEAAMSAAMKQGERYNHVGKRDPFVALIDAGPASVAAKVCDPERPRELLESFDLGAMKLTGIIEAAQGYVALIESPDGKGYTVASGMYMGKNCGLVQDIQADYMNINEKVKKPGADSNVFIDVPRTLELRP